MKVLGIVGSPRKGGNTDTLVDRVLEGAKSRNADVEKLYLRDLDISPCQGCFSCEAVKECVIPDDMRVVSAKLHEATGIVIGGPMHIGLSSELVKFLERCRHLVSYVDLLVRPSLSPSEEEVLSKDEACLEVWKNGKSYADVTSGGEEMMTAALKEYTLAYGSHPVASTRLEKGKKLVFILCYWQFGEGTYQGILDTTTHLLGTIMGLDIVDTIAAYRVLKKGDAQKRDDLMQRAFKAGQLLCQEK